MGLVVQDAVGADSGHQTLTSRSGFDYPLGHERSCCAQAIGMGRPGTCRRAATPSPFKSTGSASPMKLKSLDIIDASLPVNSEKEDMANACPFDLAQRTFGCIVIDISRRHFSRHASGLELGKKAAKSTPQHLAQRHRTPCKARPPSRRSLSPAGASRCTVRWISAPCRAESCPWIVFFAGEVLDVDGITGGFNFQAAWSTGFVAGQLR